MKRPSFFFNRDCGCYGRSQTGDDCASNPVEGAVLADNRYFSLATLPKAKILGVGSGSNQQVFIKPVVRGILFVGTTGEAEVSAAPELTLPILNPAVSSVHPVPSAFKYLMIGNGADPATWQFVAAPTSGTKLLKSVNGSFVFADVGEIPGIQEVGTDAVFTAKGDLMTLVKNDDDEWLVKKLAVVHQRVVVGDVDEDGNGGFKTLGATEFLTHPKARFTTCQARTFETLDADGVPISGGLEQAVTTGSGAITDGVQMIYSPAQKRFYKAPAHTRSFTPNTTNSGSVTPTGSFALMPSGHAAAPSVAINYPNVRVTCVIGMAADERVNFALFRDGVQLHEFTIQSADNTTLEYLDTAVPLGNHTYDVRWKKDAGATSPAASIKYTSMLVTTLN